MISIFPLLNQSWQYDAFYSLSRNAPTLIGVFTIGRNAESFTDAETKQ
jgi:hypothetical protein